MRRLGIVGLGRWGRVLVDAVQGHAGNVRFTAAVTRSDDGRAAARDAGLAVLPDLDAALADTTLDGLVLATPHSLHAEQILACVSAGKPVLVEKPFTLTAESARRAIDAARAAGVLVAAGHNRRFLPAMRRLKQAVEAGELGQALFVETNFSANAAGRYRPDQWRVVPNESPAGGLAGAGIHMIDAVIHLAGPITEVFARSRRLAPGSLLDDTTGALFGLASGGGASLTTVIATASTFRLQLFGTAGAAELRGPDHLVWTDLDGVVRDERFAPTSTERAEIEAFAAAIDGAASYPVPLDEVENGVAAFEAVVRSAETGAPVAIG